MPEVIYRKPAKQHGLRLYFLDTRRSWRTGVEQEAASDEILRDSICSRSGPPPSYWLAPSPYRRARRLRFQRVEGHHEEHSYLR